MIKCDMVINASSNKTNTTQAQVRVGGWTESWILAESPTSVASAWNAICTARARLLPGNCSIVGQRFYEIGGGSQTAGRVFPGLAATLGDVPQMALLCTVQSDATINVRRFRLGGIPDARVVEGVYNPSTSFDADLQGYWRALNTYGARFKARVLTNPSIMIVSIDVNGNLLTNANLTAPAGTLLRILHAKDSNGKPVKGVFPVITATDARHFVLGNWGGQLVKTGKVRVDEISTYRVSFNTFAVNRVVVHKVGRAFFQYRGRASKKR